MELHVFLSFLIKLFCMQDSSISFLHFSILSLCVLSLGLLIIKIISGENCLFSYGVLFLDEKCLVSSHEERGYLLTKVKALQNILSFLYAEQWAPI